MYAQKGETKKTRSTLESKDILPPHQPNPHFPLNPDLAWDDDTPASVSVDVWTLLRSRQVLERWKLFLFGVIYLMFNQSHFFPTLISRSGGIHPSTCGPDFSSGWDPLSFERITFTCHAIYLCCGLELCCSQDMSLLQRYF